jgi:hypothetical protein
MSENLINRISFYLASGGLFNPELADHIAVRTLLFECREALAQPEQEPVGKFAKFTDGIWREVTDGSAGVPLYTTPPQTEEKLITTVDIEKIVKFKERNT